MLIARIHAEGVAILLVEQNVVQSLEVADRAYVLAEGQFIMSGTAAEIGADPGLNALTWDCERMTDTLRARLARPPILVAPGVYDPLTALFADKPASKRSTFPAPPSPIPGSAAPISASSA